MSLNKDFAVPDILSEIGIIALQYIRSLSKWHQINHSITNGRLFDIT
jgi:hypothetical protein